MLWGLWFIFSLHIITFLLLLFHFIGLGRFLAKCGKALGIYYFYLVGVFFFVQVSFFKGPECSSKAPMVYFWIAAQIVMFYILVAYGIALWGAYICWQAEKEEAEIQDIVETYMKKQVA
jgi:hypothetical protein